MKKIYMIFIIGILLTLSCLAIWKIVLMVIYKRIETVALSSDSQFILFSAYCKNGENIYSCKTNGSNVNCLISQKDSKNYDPGYSPDGSKIVFASVQGEKNNADLFIMDADGSNVYSLTSGPENDDSPVWSPDGKYIYFIRSRWYGHYSPIAKLHWHEMDIYSINIKDMELKPITNKKYFQISAPSIFPDGKHILVQIYKENKDSLWVVPIDNPEKMESIKPNLEKYKADKSKKPWATEPIGYDDFYNPQISPDGKLILFTWTGHYQGYFGHEIYLMDLKTKETRRLTDMHSYIENPSFSADGTKVIFLADRKYDPTKEPNFKIWMINMNGSDLHEVKIKWK